MANDNVSSHAPIDPALVLPPAVQAQRDRANALMAAGQPPATQPTAPVPPQQGAAPTPPPGGEAQPPVQAELSMPTHQPGQRFNLDGAPPPGQAPAQPPAQPAPTPAPPAEQVTGEEWERRFHSINGRYTNEVPRLREAVQDLSARNERLERLLAGMAPPAPANGGGNGQAGPPDGTRLSSDFTPQELEDWGPEMLGMITRVADKRASHILDQITPTLQATQHAARESMEAYLDREVPEWRTVNLSQEFMNWSLLPDDFSGVIRQQLVRQAWQANQGHRVAAFFKSFLSGYPSGPAAQQPQPVPPAPQPVPPAPAVPASNRLSLAELAAPSGAGGPAAGGVPPPPAAKRVYKRSEIAQFYQDRSLGYFRGREADAQRVENDIFAAQRENRVING